MAWRFKASKYKNSVPVEPKLDKQIRELSIGSYHSCGNYIAASATHMAFNWDTLGSSLAVLPLTASGRPDKASIPRIDGHSDTVTDFVFSPFGLHVILSQAYVGAPSGTTTSDELAALLSIKSSDANNEAYLYNYLRVIDFLHQGSML